MKKIYQKPVITIDVALPCSLICTSSESEITTPIVVGGDPPPGGWESANANSGLFDEEYDWDHL